MAEEIREVGPPYNIRIEGNNFDVGSYTDDTWEFLHDLTTIITQEVKRELVPILVEEIDKVIKANIAEVVKEVTEYGEKNG